MPHFADLLKMAAEEAGISLNPSELEKFEIYFKELLAWKGKINLTSLHSPEDIAVKHFIDSLTATSLVSENCRMMDIGSGGGFPSIPLKIVMPGLKVVSIDSSAKKVCFQRHIVRLLDLNETEIIQTRIEDLPEMHDGLYDVVICRAFSSLQQFIEQAARFIKDDGMLVAMKGDSAETELSESEKALTDNFLKLDARVKINLPFDKGAREILTLKRNFS